MNLRIETCDAKAIAPLLAARVADDLRAVIAQKGSAHLAVPGGTTPGPFLAALGAIDLPWEHVTVTLTDERWVPEDHERSNQRTLRDTLFAGLGGTRPFSCRCTTVRASPGTHSPM